MTNWNKEWMEAEKLSDWVFEIGKGKDVACKEDFRD